MKLLVIDHFFKQDIEAVIAVAIEHQFEILPYSVMGSIARKYLPSWAFSSLRYEDFLQQEYLDVHKRYEKKVSELLHAIYTQFPFDAIIAPSDSIVYFRAYINCAQNLRKPVIVLQKETTISPFTMDEHAQEIGQCFPFISDLMLVCSERHKQFWLNTGADPDKIIVTGQPRFDFYHKPERWRILSDLGLKAPLHLPNLLFFSYDLDAYSPERTLAPAWKQLRTDTEETLIDLARQGYFNVLIKPHPQQQELQSNQERLYAMAGDLWGKSVFFFPREFDTRQLIVNSQVVVGFQTTALFEAMVAGKKVVYTFWTEPTAQYSDALIPFHEMGNALSIARSPQELEHLLVYDEEVGLTAERSHCRSQAFEQYLGPVDGYSAKRCMKLIEDFVINYNKT